MTRTLTALYDTRADAEIARKRLTDIGISSASIDVVDQTGAAVDAEGTAAVPPVGTASAPATAARPGFWGRFRHLFPESDRRAYEEGVHRGGALLTAAVEEAVCDRAIAVLEETRPVDLQQRLQEWREAGWTLEPAGAGPAPGAASEPRAGAAQEEIIPVADESLRVGKREMARGSVRVHSYVIEEPVQENVRLREDHVEVERRPARDTSAAEAADALQEHTVEMRETAEEPVVQKEPRIREEVVVRKRAGEHVEQVRDTVRRTRVDVERSPGTTPGRPGEAERGSRRPEERPGH